MSTYLLFSWICFVLGLIVFITNLWSSIVIFKTGIISKNSFYQQIAFLAVIDCLHGLWYFLNCGVYGLFDNYYITTVANGTDGYYVTTVTNGTSSNTMYNIVGIPNWFWSRYGCYMIDIGGTFLDPLQEMLMLCIGIERAYSILNPVKYRRIEHAFGKACIGICLFTAAIVACSGIAGSSSDLIPYCTISLATSQIYLQIYNIYRYTLFVFTCIIYIALLLFLRKKQLSVGPQQQVAAAKRQAALTKTVVLLLVAFVCTTGIGLILLVMYDLMPAGTNSDLMLSFVYGFVIFSLLNYICNFFIFPLKSDEIRGMMKKHVSMASGGRLFSQQTSMISVISIRMTQITA